MYIFYIFSDVNAVQHWLRLPSTKTRNEVPMLYREPYIQRGFRPPHQPLSYYLLSVFQLHNESMNVWTHLLAMFLMGQRFLQLMSDVDVTHDAYSWSLLGGLGCGTLAYTFSSIAHCLQSRSPFAHHLAFMLDYAGVGLFSFGGLLLHLAYSSHDKFYYAVQDFYLALGGVGAFVVTYCCTIAKLSYSRPYPLARRLWQSIPIGVMFGLAIAPVMHRFWVCFIQDQDCGDSMQYHCRQIGWFAISVFFFISHWPESAYPGRFDIFLHSHQIFHVAIMMCSLDQLTAVALDFKDRTKIIRSRPEPTVASVAGPILLLAVAQLSCIFILGRKVHKRLLETQKDP